MSGQDAETLLRQRAAERILIFDGGYGTSIQKYGLTEADYRGDLDLEKDQKGNNDLLCLTRPDIVKAIHSAYLDAGADMIETNSFSSTRIAMADYGAEHLVWELNLAAARLAREACDEAEAKDGVRRFVAGSIGPTNKTLSISPDVNDPAYREIDYDTLKEQYREQCAALIEGGVDFLLVETCFDTLNAKAAGMAAREAELHDNRHVRAEPVRPYHRGLLVFAAASEAAHHRRQLRVRGGQAAPLSQRTLKDRRHADPRLSQCGPAQRAWPI